MKKIFCILMTLTLAFTLTACGKTKVLHCDNCGTEVAVKESSNMEEGWIIYCQDCNERLFGGTLVEKE